MGTVIYVRQSLDRDGKGAAVDRQLKECRELCAANGWIVDQVYRDNDISATTGKTRPDFETLLKSNPGRIVVWHVDRLIRLSKELERVIELGVNVHAVKSGHVDLSTPAGRAVAKTITAWAQYEGEQKSLRQISSNMQRAAAGTWQFSNRPYGYERINGSVEIVEVEAAIIREAFTRYASGETYYSIVSDLNTRKVPTLRDGLWTVSQLRGRLKNPAYAGIRMYKGAIAGTGNWAPIISPDDWEQFNKTKARRVASHDWSNKTKYLLSGIAICGVCGSKMLARPEYRRIQADGTKPVRMTYQCTTGWCVSRDMQKVDDLVRGVIIARLSLPDAVELVNPKIDLTPLMIESDELRKRRDDLATALADGDLTLTAVKAASLTLTARLDVLQLQISAADGGSHLIELLMADDVADHWQNKVSFMTQRAIISTLLTVTIAKQKNTRVFDPDDVGITWRSDAQ